ncbi:hypothetical protein ACTHTR_10810, partial [Neisseria sp. P0018.S004]|uniref:hypothetical protein n=1 Tax=Neisseria sp. P0018.S004 TaxID=3436790 RepID=UPI003F7CE03C
ATNQTQRPHKTTPSKRGQASKRLNKPAAPSQTPTPPKLRKPTNTLPALLPLLIYTPMLSASAPKAPSPNPQVPSIKKTAINPAT